MNSIISYKLTNFVSVVKCSTSSTLRYEHAVYSFDPSISNSNDGFIYFATSFTSQRNFWLSAFVWRKTTKKLLQCATYAIPGNGYWRDGQKLCLSSAANADLLWNPKGDLMWWTPQNDGPHCVKTNDKGLILMKGSFLYDLF